MLELYRHIGEYTDVPAGDIGVGSREIGYLFGQYKRITNRYESGVITGKGLGWGGSRARKEATGYGVVLFAQEMLKFQRQSLDGMKVVVSGSGNVAIYAMEKAQELGAIVVACSDSSGYIYDENGIDIGTVKRIKEFERRRIATYLESHSSARYVEGSSIWSVPCDVALPCATQNELTARDAKTLVENNCKIVAEGANMPTTPEGIQLFQSAGVYFAPGKAANAGGVATSGLEMSQNSLRMNWNREEVDTKLKQIMQDIHASCVEYGTEGNHVDYVKGANIAGFVKVADAMLDQGVV
jgi:glutamate dehydrogenase (NADP+)